MILGRYSKIIYKIIRKKDRNSISYTYITPLFKFMKEMSLTHLGQTCNISYLNKENEDPLLRPRAFKRSRKSSQQLQVLLQEYQREPAWSKEFITELANRTGLTTAQIYKWSWDHKKKFHQAKRNRAETSCLSSLFSEVGNIQPLKMTQQNVKPVEFLLCNETLRLASLDSQILEIQNSYKRSLEKSCQSRTLRSILSEFI